MTQGAAPGASAPWQAAAEPSLARGSEVWLRLWVLVLTRFLFEPSERLWWVWGLIRNVILPLLSSCWSFFALGRGVSFFGGIQHSPVNSFHQQVVILEFSQEKISAHPSTVPS